MSGLWGNHMDNAELKEEIRSLIKLQTRSRNINKELLATAGFDLVTIYVLYRIDEAQSSNFIKDLATELDVSRSSLSIRFSHLMKSGLITAEPTVEDRRHEKLILTRKGRMCLAKFADAVHRVYVSV
jgi:DNA-binding MarR family transcriptional regulator